LSKTNLATPSTGLIQQYSTDVKQTEDNMLQAMKVLKQSGTLDILAEGILANYTDGEPAASFARFALGNGIHYCTANKAPIALFYDELCALAAKNGCKFRFESACGDGVPIFNLVPLNVCVDL
jgi:homoserine dehydrogenase